MSFLGRLTGVKVRHIRSVRQGAVNVELAPGCTTLVGPNLAGKSSVVHALRTALDPALPFDGDRDVPVGLDRPKPSVQCRFDALPNLDAGWRDGVWAVPEHPAVGRLVTSSPNDQPIDIIRRAIDGLEAGDDAAGASGGRVPTGHTRDAHLAEHIRAVLAAVVPEITNVVVDIDQGVLQAVDIDGWVLQQAAGIRAAVALGTAHALTEWDYPPVAIVLEEPGAFLHPAAQEILRDALGATAARTGAAILLTSESPFVVPRGHLDRVVAVARDDHGATHVVGTADGPQPQADVLGPLFRDRGLAMVFDRVAALPTGTRGVVVVEGGTDKAYLEIAAEVLGRQDVLDGVAVIDAGGAAAAALEAVVLRAETDLPVLAILDNDTPGRQARDTLAKRLGFDKRREVTTYAEVVPDHPVGTESEDLFDWRLVERYVDQRGETAIRGKKILRDDEWHFDLTSSAKSAFVGWVRRHAGPEHLRRWAELLDRIDERIRAGRVDNGA